MYLISRALKTTVEVTLGFRPGIGPGFVVSLRLLTNPSDRLRTSLRREEQAPGSWLVLEDTGRYPLVI